jgi:hypothetical protein
LSVYITFISVFNQENSDYMIALKSKMIEICFVLVNNKDSFVVNNMKIAPLYRKRH